MRRTSPSSAVRLCHIDPPHVASVVTERVLMLLETTRRALGLAEKRLYPRRTPVYGRVLALAQYAATGAPLARGVVPEAEVRWLEGLLHLAPLSPTGGEPRDQLEAVLHGALARHTLAARRPLSAAHLALLCGYDRDHVLAIAETLPGAYRSEREPRRPWRFRVNRDLRAFLAARRDMPQPAASARKVA